MSDLNERNMIEVITFAIKAHGKQERKYSGEPYMVHPLAVADLVARHGGTNNMIKAAILHDVLEDTCASSTDLMGEFGLEVSDMVVDLSEREYDDMNRAKRKAAEAYRLGQCSANVQTIKVADLIDNTKSIIEEDPNFAKVYIWEKLELLEYLGRADTQLLAIAQAQVLDAIKQLYKDK